ncbi:MAG TPA: SBBP repeat-containing protein [Candidatus Sulfotelmatobacter sp.]
MASARPLTLPLQTVAPNSRPSLDQKLRLTSALSSLPLMFEPNVGQSDSEVKFLARGVSSRGLGYGVFLTPDGATLSFLGQKDPQSRPNTQGLRMKLANSNPHAHITGESLLPGKSNYLIGNDPSRWHRDVPQFSRVRYESIYPGIDLVFYGNRGRMEYDFKVAPGSDSGQAELQFDGAKRVELKDGNLILHADGGSVQLDAPRGYQRIGDREQPVQGRFEMRGSNRVGFAVGPYDRSRELVIDPVLEYSTYFGGSGDEHSTSIAVDSVGNIYLAGSTDSAAASFPTAGTQTLLPAGLATTPPNTHVYVAKITLSDTTSAVYETFLGGTGSEFPVGIAVDGGGNAYVAGTTVSTDFPTTATSAYQSGPQSGSTGPSHVFVSVLNATGSSLNYSSYLSGNGEDIASGMTIDSRGAIFVTGTTTSTDGGANNDQFPASFPPEALPFQSTPRGATKQFFVTKVNTAAFGIGSIVYSTYFGGGTPTDGIAIGGGIAVDSTGNIYFSGTTNFIYTGQSSTTDFPILDAYQPCLDQPPPVLNSFPQTCTYSPTPTATDAFVAKLNPNNSGSAQLVWSTYFGGTGDDSGAGVAVDSGAANVYIVGTTNSPGITGVTTFAGYQPCLNTPPATIVCPTTIDTTHTDAYVARFNNTITSTTNNNEILALSYFSYLGGTGNDAGLAIAVDSVGLSSTTTGSGGDALVTGWTQSADFPFFPTSGVIQSALSGPQDAFFAHLNSTTVTGQNTNGAYVTYFGGTGTDEGTSIAIDTGSNIYVAGDTNSADFQTLNPLQAQNNGGVDAFALKFGTQADLGVTGSVSLGTSQFASAGSQVTFSYIVTNSGPDLATQVTFSDNLSATGQNLTFVSATATSGSCSATATTNSTVVCTIPALQPTGTATVTVVLTPSTSGNFNGGAVSVFSPGNNDPLPSNNTTTVQTQASDFTVSLSPSNQSIAAAGDTAVYNVTITPVNPFSGTIALTCCTNLPTGATGVFSVSSVTLTGLSPVSSQLNITTTARPATTAMSTGKLRQLYALFLSLPGIAMVGLGWKPGRRRKMAAIIAACMLFAMIILVPACSSKTTATPVTGTPSGTYSLVLTATSGTDTKNATFTLTVP